MADDGTNLRAALTHIANAVDKLAAWADSQGEGDGAILEVEAARADLRIARGLL